MIPRVFDSPEARNATLVRLGALAVVLAVATFAILERAPSLTDPTWVRETVSAAGPFAPLVFVGIQTAQVIVAPIPGQALAAVGGYLFGTLAGTAYSMVGVVLGSAVVFLLARRFGRPFVERAIDPDTLSRFDDFAERSGVVGLFVLFLLPTFPDDALCAIVVSHRYDSERSSSSSPSADSRRSCWRPPRARARVRRTTPRPSCSSRWASWRLSSSTSTATTWRHSPSEGGAVQLAVGHTFKYEDGTTSFCDHRDVSKLPEESVSPVNHRCTHHRRGEAIQWRERVEEFHDGDQRRDSDGSERERFGGRL